MCLYILHTSFSIFTCNMTVHLQVKATPPIPRLFSPPWKTAHPQARLRPRGRKTRHTAAKALAGPCRLCLVVHFKSHADGTSRNMPKTLPKGGCRIMKWMGYWLWFQANKNGQNMTPSLGPDAQLTFYWCCCSPIHPVSPFGVVGTL